MACAGDAAAARGTGVWVLTAPPVMLASTGPAYEAIREVGEEEFRRFCVEVATERVRDGLPLRAEIDCVGFTAAVPVSTAGSTVLLGEAAPSAAAAALSADDVAELGFVSNVTRLWSHDPEASEQLFELIGACAQGAGLSFAERGVATIISATLIGDGYCPLAWGDKLAGATTAEIAGSVLGGSAALLDDRGRAVAAWARKLATEPRSVTPADVDDLIEAGFDRAQVLRLTLFIALRIAFSTVNGALGARPEAAYVEHVDPVVREAWERLPARR